MQIKMTVADKSITYQLYQREEITIPLSGLHVTYESIMNTFCSSFWNGLSFIFVDGLGGAKLQILVMNRGFEEDI